MSSTCFHVSHTTNKLYLSLYLAMETVVEVNNNQIAQAHPLGPPKFIASFKRLIFYILGYPLFLLLLVSYLLSRIYTCALLLILRPHPLAPSDACWANEEDSSPSNIVLQLKLTTTNPNFLAELRAKLEKLLANPTYSKLTTIITQRYGIYCHQDCQDSKVDLKNHLLQVTTPTDGVVEFYLGTRLPQTVPQWRIVYVQEENTPTSGLIFVFHHSYGDGISWVGLISELADESVTYYIDPYQVKQGKEQSFLKNLCLLPHHFSRQLTWILSESNQFHGPLANNTKSICQTKVELSEFKKSNKTLTEQIQSRLGSAFLGVFTKQPSHVLAISPYAKLPYTGKSPVNQFYPCFDVVRVGHTLFRGTESSNCSSSDETVRECNLIISKICGGLVAPLQTLVAYLGARGTIAFSNLPSWRNEIVICGQVVREVWFTPPVKFR